jgi:hypothetical protein
LDIVDKYSQKPECKFYGNLSSGSRGDTCGEMDRRMEVSKVLGAIRGYANTLKNN